MLELIRVRLICKLGLDLSRLQLKVKVDLHQLLLEMKGMLLVLHLYGQKRSFGHTEDVVGGGTAGVV